MIDDYTKEKTNTQVTGTNTKKNKKKGRKK